jgi:glycine/D-amino acid oxidase-like deaminating enzyme
MGVEKINQLVTSTTDKERAKTLRRYKKLTQINSPLLKDVMEGAELLSFLIDPKILNDWFNDQISRHPLTQKKNFLTRIAKNAEGIIECVLLNKEIIKTKKIVLCTGAYAKIFSDFNEESDYLQNTQVVSGSFLERSINLKMASFSITIDGCKLVYRSMEQKLILGSVTNPEGAIVPDHQVLKAMLDLFNQNCSFSLGEYSDFKVVTGLRHKGVRRRPMAQAIDIEKNIFAINGLYKNGYTFSHLCAKRVLGLINL